MDDVWIRSRGVIVRPIEERLVRGCVRDKGHARPSRGGLVAIPRDCKRRHGPRSGRRNARHA